MSLIERARSSLAHIECFYEAKDGDKRIKDMIEVINAAEAMQVEIDRLRHARQDDLSAIQLICEDDESAPMSRIYRFVAQKLASLDRQGK